MAKRRSAAANVSSRLEITVVSENVEEKEAVATKEITTVPTGFCAPFAAR